MDKAAPVIVKRVRKVAAGHHGGAWKVAYADFVTAMMAFFLVLWLVGVASKKEKAAISEYFKNPSAVVGRSATPSASTAGPGGAADKMLPTTDPILVPRGVGAASGTAVSRAPDADQLERRERRALEALKRDIERAIDANGALARFREQLLLDITSEGLRIQILDREQRPMFDLGSVTLKPYTQAALRELGAMLQQRQNRIAISGHTDEVQFHAPRGYGNWELSAERANAARRALVDGGLTENKIARVVGLAASEPLDRDDPLAPVNRRISIVVLNRASDAVAGTARAIPPDGLSTAGRVPAGR